MGMAAGGNGSSGACGVVDLFLLIRLRSGTVHMKGMKH
jgi:hypothetical protein